MDIGFVTGQSMGASQGAEGLTRTQAMQVPKFRCPQTMELLHNTDLFYGSLRTF